MKELKAIKLLLSRAERTRRAAERQRIEAAAAPERERLARIMRDKMIVAAHMRAAQAAAIRN